MKKDQNNRLVPPGPLFSWLAKENLKFGHNLYLCFPIASNFTDLPSTSLYVIITFTNPVDISEKIYNLNILCIQQYSIIKSIQQYFATPVGIAYAIAH